MKIVTNVSLCNIKTLVTYNIQWFVCYMNLFYIELYLVYCDLSKTINIVRYQHEGSQSAQLCGIVIHSRPF